MDVTLKICLVVFRAFLIGALKELGLERSHYLQSACDPQALALQKDDSEGKMLAIMRYA